MEQILYYVEAFVYPDNTVRATARKQKPLKSRYLFSGTRFSFNKRPVGLLCLYATDAIEAKLRAVEILKTSSHLKRVHQQLLESGKMLLKAIEEASLQTNQASMFKTSSYPRPITSPGNRRK